MLGGGATALAAAVGVALLVSMPIPVGHGPAVAPLTITAAPMPPGSGIDAYDAAVQQAFARVSTAVAASAELRAVPSNLDPPLADTVSKKTLVASTGCFRSFFDVGQPECATGDTGSKTTVALVGDSHAAMWSPAFSRSPNSAAGGWKPDQGGCPLLDLPIINPIVGREYRECEQWRGEITARLEVEHLRLIVLSVMRRYGAGHGWAAG